MSIASNEPRDIHRIGGATIENLRLRAKEASLGQPGISVIKAPSPAEAVQELRAGLPKARALHEAAKTVGSTTEGLIRSTGFDIIPAPSQALSNHHRIIHPQGAAGFSDKNLERLAEVFENTTDH